MKKRLIVIVFLVLCLALPQWAAVFAASDGSLTVKLQNENTGAAFSDFTVNVWYVADNSLTPSADFKNAQVDWKLDFSLKANNSQITDSLYKYIEQNKIEPTYKKVTGNDGEAYFGSLDGIYLISSVDNRSTARFIFTNFIVPVPFNGSGAVVAAPKGKTPTTPTTPSTPTHRTTPSRTTPAPRNTISEEDVPRTQPPDDGWVNLDEPETPLADLPQTGMLLWPVPVFGFAGLAAIAIGLRMIRREKKPHEG